MQSGSRRAILAALGANFGIAVAKFIGFAVTGAASMLAEAVHSVADTSNQALLLWGGAAARREPTEQHPFGFGRERYFWAFVVALVIFSLGALFAIVEGIDKLWHPHALEHAGWAVAILVVGMLLEGLSLRTAVGEARPLRRGRSWWAFIHKTKNPELPVVLLEDLGALCGLLLALMGVGLAWATGEPRFDALGSVAIGVLLAIIAAVLAVEMKSLLIGEAALGEQVAEIREALLEGEEVRRLIHLRTMHLGPDQLLVAAKLEFREELSLREVSNAINRAERSVRERIPIARMIFIEPDVYDPSRPGEG